MKTQPEVIVTNADMKIIRMFISSKTTIYTADLTDQEVFDELTDYLYNNSDDNKKD